MEDVKIIVIGDSKKISPAMMGRLHSVYQCKIEFMTADEFKASGLKEEEISRAYTLPKPKTDEFFELSKVPQVNLSDIIIEKKNSKPYNPKTIGKVNRRKTASVQRCNSKRLGSR